MQGRPTTIIVLPQPRVSSTSCFAFCKILFSSWSPWQTIALSTLFLMLIMHSCFLADCHFFFVLLGKLPCIHLWCPQDTLLSEGHLLSWYSNFGCPVGPTMQCSSFCGHWKLIYPSTSTRQAKRLSNSSELTTNFGPVSVQYWGELPSPHSLSLSS
jgi:hypothetical protein